MTLGTISEMPTVWLIYVGNTFIHWPQQIAVQIVLDHVNSIRTSKERKKYNPLAFLGVLIIGTDSRCPYKTS